MNLVKALHSQKEVAFDDADKRDIIIMMSIWVGGLLNLRPLTPLV
jgi:hypothetical protein